MRCYPATLTPHPLHAGRYDVTFVDFPGCTSSGESLGEALHMAQEVLSLHVGAMLADGDSLPSPSSLDDERETVEENDPLPQGTLWQFVWVKPARRKFKDEATVRLSISLRPAIVEKLDHIVREYINRMA